ncbi:hypothetical protein [Achromobacter spanius]|uniref:hypothetical protein n=1 Tax=Achromobacter spanius TaxID=217203 RepID=UPI00381934E7
MDAPDSGIATTPPFDALRAYLQAAQSRDDLLRIRQLAQRNGGLKRSLERSARAQGAAGKAPDQACWKLVLRDSRGATP